MIYNEVKKNKVIKYSAAFLIIILVGILINQGFNKPTNFNYFIASKIYEAPANSAFTDENLYKCVVDAYNNENNASVAYTESLIDEQLSTIKRLVCSDNGITSTNGLEKLVSLTYLRLDNNNITEINLSKNANLQTLLIWDNQLTNLDISKNLLLEEVEAHKNNILKIDLSENNELIKLVLSENILSETNLINNIKLTDLSIYGNKLASLDISNNTLLTELDAFENELSSIDLSNNLNLADLYLHNNQLSEIDISRNTALTSLNISGNELTKLDLSNNNLLRFLSVSENNLSELDVTEKIELVSLYADSNNFSEINITNNTKLRYLNIGMNKISSLDVTNNTELIRLSCSFNELNFIDISKNVKLTDLFLGNNQLTELDLSNNTELEEINLHNNKLDELDLSHNPNIEFITLYENPFSHNIGIYVNSANFDEVNSTTSKVVSPQNKSISYDKLIINNLEDGVIPIETPGLYTVQAQYIIDFQSWANQFTENYNFCIIEATSEKYLINEEEGYIYTGIDTDEETILSNISLNYGEASIENNKLLIKYEDEIIKEFDIVNISSNKYDLTKDYIFEYVENNITINNGTINKNTENNTLEIKYGEKVLETYKLVEVISVKYDVSNSTIKVQDNTINEFVDKINCINCEPKIYDGESYLTEGEFTDNNRLIIMYGEDVLKEYSLIFAVNGVTLNKESMKLGLEKKTQIQLEATISPKKAENKNVSWTSSNETVATVDNNGLVTSKGLGKATITVTTEEGGYTDTVEVEVANIITYQITYKDGENIYIEDYEEDEVVELKDDLTKSGYTLIGWKFNDKEYKLEDEFIMIADDITLNAIWELIIPDIEKTSKYKVKENIITGISLGTKIESLKLGLDDIYKVKTYNKNNVEKTTGNIATSDKLKIYLGDTLVSEYILSVKGDVTGTGTSTVSDVAKLYQYLKKKIDMEDCYKEAGNVVSTDNEIKINDVAKLYQFIKGKISSLED